MTTFADETRTVLEDRLLACRLGRQVLHVPREDDPFVPHGHMHFHPVPELAIQLSGISLMRFPRETIPCHPGSILLLPRGVAHAERVECTPEGFCNHVVMFGRETVSIHEALAGSHRRPRVARLQQFAVADASRIYGYLDDICTMTWDGGPHADVAVSGLLTAFLATMLNVQERSLELSRRESYKVAQCRRMITERLTDPLLNVQALAGWIGCSADYLSHLFRTQTGMSIIGHMNRKRIDFARNLLETSTLNVSEVAHACGYRDPGYMTRQFKRLVGRTPRDYRRALRMA